MSEDNSVKSVSFFPFCHVDPKDGSQVVKGKGGRLHYPLSHLTGSLSVYSCAFKQVFFFPLMPGKASGE